MREEGRRRRGVAGQLGQQQKITDVTRHQHDQRSAARLKPLHRLPSHAGEPAALDGRARRQAAAEEQQHSPRQPLDASQASTNAPRRQLTGTDEEQQRAGDRRCRRPTARARRASMQRAQQP